MNKKVIITGATGQDGSYFIDYLLENTDNTIIAAVRRTSQAILDNLKHNIHNPRLKMVTLDLTDPNAVRNLIKEEEPDYFINLGAQTFVADSWKSPVAHMNTNAMTVIYILEAIKEYSPLCRFYSAGSSEQWGNVSYSPQDEKHPLRPRSVYGVSKCAAALLTKVYRESYGLYAVHGILFNHESPRRQKYFVTRKVTHGASVIYNQIKDNKPVTPIELGNLDAKRDWSHAKDFVDGIWRMLNQEKYNPTLQRFSGSIDTSNNKYPSSLVDNIEEYVLSSDECHSIRELVELTFKKVYSFLYKYSQGSFYWKGSGLSEEYVFETRDGKLYTLVKINKDFFRPAEVDLLWGNSQKARESLGWSPKYSFEELINEMVENDIM